jgi:predicted ribosomally synthesized peptide with SipW-like signal peptide
MKILLSIVVIAALMIAGIGGTLAGFSDTEESFNNIIQSGSIDLRVNGKDQAPWGEGIDTIIQLDRIMPDKEYWAKVIVANCGESLEADQETPEPAWLYIHFKNMVCTNDEPEHLGIDISNPQPDWPDIVLKNPDAILPPDGSPFKPEPECVAEFGGMVEQTWVDGLGQLGDECCLGTHVEITIWVDDETGDPVWGPDFIGLLNCNQLEIGPLEPCGVEHTIIMKIVLPQEQFEDLTWEGHPKFKHWPANAFMNDRLTFDLMFKLLQERLDD